jgi:hypothetical protein
MKTYNYKITIYYENGFVSSFERKEKARYAGKLFKKLMQSESIKNVEIECLDEDDD